MQLTESHVIKPNSPHYDEIDQAAFLSKNLYNLATYYQRQQHFGGERVYTYVGLYSFLKHESDYKALPTKVAQQTLKLVDKAWKSYFAALKSFSCSPEKFQGRPKPPNYKHKSQGRSPLVYTIQAISGKMLRSGIVKPSGLGLKIRTKVNLTDINQVRIVPKKTHYVVEVVYTVEPQPADLDHDLIAGVDLGLNNLAVVSSNKRGYTPLVVNGKPLKSINQFYNKRKAQLQSMLDDTQSSSHRIDRMADKRNRRIDNYLHTASKRIIDHLVDQGIGVLVIGHNEDWKYKINIGKKNNQNFVSIPHARFIHVLQYKGKLTGINVITNEESYTSKTSFLDSEDPVKHEVYAGRRVKRGLFKSGSGRLINADLNGSYQIIRKVAPAAFSQGVEDVAVHPSPLMV